MENSHRRDKDSFDLTIPVLNIVKGVIKPVSALRPNPFATINRVLTQAFI